MTDQANETDYTQRPPRQAVDVDTAAVDGDGRELRLKLWNTSDGGFMAECEERLPIGAVIELDLPGRGRVGAEVRWVLGWRFGAKILDANPAA